MKFIVKICGITNGDDAQAAISMGADALGFMFYSGSARFVTLEAVAMIGRGLPTDVLKVGVFVDAPKGEIDRAVGECGLDVVQLHGHESPEFCASIKGVGVMKAQRVADERSIDELVRYRTDFWLLDSFVPGAHGGTGQSFNWELARRARSLGTRFLLAGGLTPGNVAKAIQTVIPNGVDVSSGVEASPGRKDPEKLRSFIVAAKEAAATMAIESRMAKA